MSPESCEVYSGLLTVFPPPFELLPKQTECETEGGMRHLFKDGGLRYTQHVVCGTLGLKCLLWEQSGRLQLGSNRPPPPHFSESHKLNLCFLKLARLQ